ncbi:hypothetical protein BCR32DRAFT_290721 [Anaeromyces robustus]|uniref:Uncharacterized protein n=1 Tax=Anaeromyces robustus TaxID=1754192 RepID=A0A1Y1XI45_9FUNG|nr:hypothetical protein BCR32DRAFT_290721 [Anaeromyces robustus]|eukprot:ORX85425.1 hypothetical protein BCR32DRAFT_290721 [Anaeromyces robustus]
MRPDPYKQKKSRRYQLTHKNKLANKNEKNDDKAPNEKKKDLNDNTSNDDNNYNNNNTNNKKPFYNKKINKKYNRDDEENSKSYGRRKIFDNSYRYEEPTYEEQLEAEAEIDVAVEDALSLINSKENNTNYDPSSYFQFKKENWLNNEEFSDKDDKIQEIFNIDFNKLDKSLQNVSTWDRIKINKNFIIDNDDNGCINEPNKIKKIIPSYNYIRNDSISLNPSFNFNTPTDIVSSNNVVKEINKIDSNENKINMKNENKNEINTNYSEKNKLSNTTELKPSKPIDTLAFDIDELITDKKPINQKKDTDIDDELDMLLSLNTTKSNNNKIDNIINNDDLLNNLNDLNNTPTNKTDNNNNNNSKNNQNIENLQDWLDDLLS